MRLLHTIISSLIAFAALGHGAPPAEDIPEERFRPDPDRFCAHHYKGMFSRYWLIGNQWPVHERMIWDSVKSARPRCALTNWRYREITHNDTGLVDFNCTVSRSPQVSSCFMHADLTVSCVTVRHASPVPEEGTKKHQQLSWLPTGEEGRRLVPREEGDQEHEASMEGPWSPPCN